MTTTADPIATRSAWTLISPGFWTARFGDYEAQVYGEGASWYFDITHRDTGETVELGYGARPLQTRQLAEEAARLLEDCDDE